MRSVLKISLLWCAVLLPAPWTCAGTELGDALNHAADPRHGQELFETCAKCHQADGSGAGKKGIPAIAGQHFKVILGELADFRATRRLDPRMELYASKHELPKGRDLADVASYVASMPTVHTSELGSGQHTEEGRLAYERACVRCHGARGEGDARLRYPRLAGQHYTYLLNQLDAMIGGYRFNVDRKHQQSIADLGDEEMTGIADYLARLNTDESR